MRLEELAISNCNHASIEFPCQGFTQVEACPNWGTMRLGEIGGSDISRTNGGATRVMQFIQHGNTFINVNRIVRIEAEERAYIVVWLNEQNKPVTVRLLKKEAESFQYLLSK